MRKPLFVPAILFSIACLISPPCFGKSTSSKNGSKNNSGSNKWPFVKWEYARAYYFNAYRKEIYFQHIRQRRTAYKVFTVSKGFIPARHIKLIRNISKPTASKVVNWVNLTRGTVKVSKCWAPRHAIVFFNKHHQAVASANICFECGDFLTSPDFPNKDNKDNMTDKEMTAHRKASQADFKHYEKLYPLWQRLFREELKMPTPWFRKDALQ